MACKHWAKYILQVLVPSISSWDKIADQFGVDGIQEKITFRAPTPSLTIFGFWMLCDGGASAEKFNFWKKCNALKFAIPLYTVYEIVPWPNRG